MKKYIVFLFIMSGLLSCSDLLEEEVFVEVASNNFFQNDQDAQDAVYALYAKLRSDGPVTDNNGQREGWGFYGMGEGSIFNLNEVPTDEIYVAWESYGGFWQYLEEYTWLANSGSHFDQLFADLYEGIGIANNILANINNDGISKEVQDRVKGEALMARGLFYSTLYSFYENVPLVLDVVKDPLSLPTQANPDSTIQSVVNDLTAAAELLPVAVAASDIGRFTKGAALAQLARFQLNQKNWVEARDAAKAVVDMNTYSLSDTYAGIFTVENADNPEIIMSIPCIAQPGIGNTFIAHTAEPTFVSGSWGGHLVRKDFYNTFDPADIRRSYLIKEFIKTTGELDSVTQGYMIMKYEIDPNHVGAWAGNDWILHRYAEVLLTLAEANNEIEGPNQASIDLINQIRSRAFNGNVTKLVQLADFTSKEALRDFILNERGWEFYAEGYRRDDLKRQDKLITNALDRGKDAKPYQVLYPIPQTERDKNPNLEQNEGYN